MEVEIRRRLDILDKHVAPKITQSQLRGGMQSRLKRQEVLRYGEDINRQKKKLQSRLSLIEQAKQSEGLSGSFSMQSVQQNIEPLDDFNEPVFRKIRSRRGFFDL